MIKPNADALQWAEAVWPKMLAKMDAQVDRIGSNVPYTLVNGKSNDMMEKSVYWWTNGFWPGMLWLMYDDTKDERYRKAAEKIEEKFDDALAGYEGLHHDVGFMWTLSSRLNHKITGNPRSRARALHAANILAGRYNPRGHYIGAWNNERSTWIIIDCMMNIPILYWASEVIKDPRYKYTAIEHADTALKYLVRPDGSCNHIGVIDPHNGNLLETPAGQGYASGSAWSRGQSWGLYGFALSYIHTGDTQYLEASLRIAEFVLKNLAETNYAPAVDYFAPKEPKLVDTSAGMIAAAGLLTLSGIDKNSKKDFCMEGAMNILRSLETLYADWDPQKDFIVKNGAVLYHAKPEELNCPLIYGDYYFLESLFYLRHPDFEIW
jgi:unsaturated chondroitin disaccharide hydrolase